MEHSDPIFLTIIAAISIVLALMKGNGDDIKDANFKEEEDNE